MAALDRFHRALTRRWQKLVCEAILDSTELEGTHQFPTVLRARVPSYLLFQRSQLWDYRHANARVHLLFGCDYVAWVHAGADGAVSAVSCAGATGIPDEPVPKVDPRTDEEVMVPPNIECGMGTILQQVENWAWAERSHVFGKLPLFDSHDLGALERAHDAFITIGRHLNLVPKEDSGGEVGASFTAVGARELPDVVHKISAKGGGDQDWWAGWTGLVASRAKVGFFASVEPSLSNQSGIAGCLANLYSGRAAIIEKGRRDGLAWVEWATGSLDETEVTTTDLSDAWTVVQGVGAGIVVYSAWTGVGALAGATISLVGFLGSNLLPETKSEGYAHSIEEAVDMLHDKIDELNTEIDELELDYLLGATSLRSTMHGVHSYNLELYDLTRNDPTGDRDERDRSAGSFQADVGAILRLAEKVYEAAGEYESLLPTIADTTDADPHLADKDGAHTDADNLVLELRNQLDGHLRTTCGRYLVAGDQVKRAAEDYVEVDTSQQATFDDYMKDWGRAGVGEYDVDFSPDEYAEKTDRSPINNPYERALAPGPRNQDYVH